MSILANSHVSALPPSVKHLELSVINFGRKKKLPPNLEYLSIQHHVVSFHNLQCFVFTYKKWRNILYDIVSRELRTFFDYFYSQVHRAKFPPTLKNLDIRTFDLKGASQQISNTMKSLEICRFEEPFSKIPLSLQKLDIMPFCFKSVSLCSPSQL